MCGIAGFFGLEGQAKLADCVEAMAATLVHRGPDDAGVWVDEACGVALSHRRLSILDLSPAGHQPMFSASGRHVIVFNGEIYNHLELRERLKGVAWRGHSDTETLVEAIDAWGIDETLSSSVGMFAFAVWDRAERTLTLCRDRLGEKPLYYGRLGKAVVFASELKAVLALPSFEARVDRQALTLLLRHNYVPAPWSIYEGIRKVMPGTYLTFRSPTDDGTCSTYWSALDIAEAGMSNPFAGDDEEALERLDRLLRDAVRAQMISDVPLGAFLSGGIDSSLVVALMQAQSTKPVKTFTIGFHEEVYNEAVHAKAVAASLGTDHTELYMTPAECREVIPRLATIYDEPFADSSQIPTFLVSEMARRHVTVSLSGDGGDELFGGYPRYTRALELYRENGLVRRAERIPGLLMFFRLVTPSLLDRLYHRIRPALPGRFRNFKNPGSALHSLLVGEEPMTFERLYLTMMSHWNDPAGIVISGREPSTAVNDPSRWLDSPSHEQRMMFLDLVTYLPDDILVKVDRAAMAVSLETRVPFLDHRVVEFAWTIPVEKKIRAGQGKWILKKLLGRYVPMPLVDRPKMGFGMPIDAWLRGPLREWAEDLLEEHRLRREGFFNPAPIREKWEEHLEGKSDWHYLLWDVLMFQAWLEEQSRRLT